MIAIRKLIATTFCVLLLLACVSPVLAHHDMAAHGQAIIDREGMSTPTKEVISKIDASTKIHSKDTPTPDAYKVLYIPFEDLIAKDSCFDIFSSTEDTGLPSNFREIDGLRYEGISKEADMPFAFYPMMRISFRFQSTTPVDIPAFNR